MIVLSYRVSGRQHSRLALEIVLSARGCVEIESDGWVSGLEWSPVEQMISDDSGAEAVAVEIDCDQPLALAGPGGGVFEIAADGYHLEVISEQLCLVSRATGRVSARYLATLGGWQVEGDMIGKLRLVPALPVEGPPPLHLGPRHRHSSLAERSAAAVPPLL